VLSLLTEGEPFDIVRNTRSNHGMEAWRTMVQRWEPRVPSRFRGMMQAVLYPKWDIPGLDATHALSSWEKEVRDYEQQSGDKVSDAIKLGVVLHHLPDQSLREHLLLNATRYDTYDKVSAEVRQVTMAKMIWQGPAPMDLNALHSDVRCTTCGKPGHHPRDCWFKDAGKGKKGGGKATPKGEGKGKDKGKGKGKDGKPKKKGLCHNCGKEGHFARDCRSKKTGDSAAAVELTYLGVPDLEESWLMMLEHVEQGKILTALEQEVQPLNAVVRDATEFLVDSGAACHAYPLTKGQRKTGNGTTYVTASGQTITSGGTQRLTYHVEATNGRKIGIDADFEDLPVHRPLLSVGMLYEQGYDVRFSKRHGCYIELKGVKVQLEKKRGVFVLPADMQNDLCPVEVEEQASSSSAAAETLPGGEQNEVKRPFVRNIPYTPSDQERLEHAATHIPFRVWCRHCCDGKARDWPHKRDYGPPPEIPMVAMDFLFLNTDIDDEVLTVLSLKEKPGQAVGATALPDKSASEFAVAAVAGYLDFWGLNDVTLKCDQEPSMKKIVDVLKEKRTHRTLVELSPKYSHQSNGVIESAHYHLEAQIRTLKSDFEQKTGVLITAKSMMTPWLVRHAAWLITRFSIGADGVTAYRRLRGKDYRSEIAEIGENVSYRIANRTQAKLDTRWESDGVFLGKTDNSDEAIIGTPRGIELVRSFRKREQAERWSADAVRMFVGVPWNPRGVVADGPGGVRRKYVTRALVVKHGATEGCPGCAGDSQVHIARCRKRFEEIFDAEKKPGEPYDRVPVEPGAVRPAASSAAAAAASPVDSAIVPVAPAAPLGAAAAAAAPMQIDVADGSMDFQPVPHGNVAPTTPLGAPPGAKRRRGVVGDDEMIGAVCELEYPDIDWEQLGTDTDTTYDVYTGLPLDKQEIKQSRGLEVENMLQFGVFDEVDEASVGNHRIWNTGWLDHQKTATLVRSRLVAKQVRGASKREDVFAGTPPLGMMRYLLSRAASRGRSRNIASYDVSVAFFHAPIDELVFVRPPRDMRKPGIVWRLGKAMYGTQVAAKAWQALVRGVLTEWGLGAHLVDCLRGLQREGGLDGPVPRRRFLG
jgi:hypothetical protein